MFLYVLQNLMDSLPLFSMFAVLGLILSGFFYTLRRHSYTGGPHGRAVKVMTVALYASPFLGVATVIGVQLWLPNNAETQALAGRITGYPASRITVTLTDDPEAAHRVLAAFKPLMRAHARHYRYHGITSRGQERYTQRAANASLYRIEGNRLIIITALPVRDELLEALRQLTRRSPSTVDPSSAIAYTPFVDHIKAVQLEDFQPWRAGEGWIPVPPSHI
ncbi:hypothetical protein [Salinicola sp. CPA57]|uniref:hypothetical protein n=1 Tax=Salinicola sp. CPA57 TaxID=1949080 RepID=UPI000DA15F77|nr:hypothetical protein [Salinicola sp. CPA57]